MTQLCPEYLYCRFIAAKFKRRGKSSKFFSSKGIGSTDNRMIREFSPHSVFTGVVFVAHTLHIVSALKTSFYHFASSLEIPWYSSRISSSSLLSLPCASFSTYNKNSLESHHNSHLRSIRSRASDGEDFVYVIIEKHKVPSIKNKHTQSENFR